MIQQVFNTPYVPPSDDYKPPVISVHSWSHAIKLGLLERLKVIPPFKDAAKFTRANARPTQAEHIPFLAVYLLDESFEPLGDFNHTEPKFRCNLKLGISYIVQNNDPDAAEDILDAAHWSFMKLFHDPKWSQFSFPHPSNSNRVMQIEGVSSGSHDRAYGQLSNETPIAEMRMEMTYVHGFDFEPVPLDNFEIFHMETWPWPAQPGETKPIITEWVLPTP